jgi:hypothetical protein
LNSTGRKFQAIKTASLNHNTIQAITFLIVKVRKKKYSCTYHTSQCCHQSLKGIAAGIKFESHKFLLMTALNVPALVSHTNKCSKVYKLVVLIHGCKIVDTYLKLKDKEQAERHNIWYSLIRIILCHFLCITGILMQHYSHTNMTDEILCHIKAT